MSKIYKIEITTTAEVEAEEVILWLKEHLSEAAKRFQQGLVKSLESLQSNPFRCSLAPENDFFMRKSDN
ncbi:MAG: type II toxin-antitoxin system RelE/ParE family toxin [Pyrinomonadaceae bacterium]